jgi:hypothetical protein
MKYFQILIVVLLFSCSSFSRIRQDNIELAMQKDHGFIVLNFTDKYVDEALEIASTKKSDSKWLCKLKINKKSYLNGWFGTEEQIKLTVPTGEIELDCTIALEKVMNRKSFRYSNGSTDKTKTITLNNDNVIVLNILPVGIINKPNQRKSVTPQGPSYLGCLLFPFLIMDVTDSNIYYQNVDFEIEKIKQKLKE